MGRGHSIAALSPVDQAKAYRAAMRATFDLDDSSLVLLAHPRLLARYRNDTAGTPLSPALDSALRLHLTRGSCLPVAVAGRKTPRCPSAGSPGYVVRFSDIFVFPSDTLLLYADVEAYDTQDAPSTQVIHFESAYKVVPQDGEWRAVKEGRVPKG